VALTPVYTDAFASSINAGWTNPIPLTFSLGNEGTWGWVSSGLIRGESTVGRFSLMARNTGTYANDGYVIASVPAYANNEGGVGVIFRADHTTGQCYAFVMSSIVGDTGKYGLFKFTSGTWTPWQFSAGTAGGFPAALIKAEFQGSNLRMYTDEGSGYVERLNVTEATLASGRPGLWAYNDTGSALPGVNSFEGGDITVSSSSLLKKTRRYL
jgi:hypothetical protein